jgi:hypothetical protein
MSIWDFFKPKPTPKPEIIVGLEGAVAVDKLAKVIKIEEFAEYGPEHNEIKRKIQSPIATLTNKLKHIEEGAVASVPKVLSKKQLKSKLSSMTKTQIVEVALVDYSTTLKTSLKKSDLIAEVLKLAK